MCTASVCGIWLPGAEQDPEKLARTNLLLNAVRVEAQVVCVGQPMVIVGDFCVIPCLVGV